MLGGVSVLVASQRKLNLSHVTCTCICGTAPKERILKTTMALARSLELEKMLIRGRKCRRRWRWRRFYYYRYVFLPDDAIRLHAIKYTHTRCIYPGAIHSTAQYLAGTLNPKYDYPCCRGRLLTFRPTGNGRLSGIITYSTVIIL